MKMQQSVKQKFECQEEQRPGKDDVCSSLLMITGSGNTHELSISPRTREKIPLADG